MGGVQAVKGLGEKFSAGARWLWNFPVEYAPRRPGLWALGLGGAGATLLLVAVIFDDRILTPTWPDLAGPLKWLVTIVVGSLALASYVHADIWWQRGKGAREKTRPIEQLTAQVGYLAWLAGTTFGTLALLSGGVNDTSRVSWIFFVFGVLFFGLGTTLGGVPHRGRGLRPLLLSKRVMNWQLAVSTAVVVGGLNSVVGGEEALFDVLGDNWGMVWMGVACWLLGAAAGTVLYEPLKFRLEEDEDGDRLERDGLKREVIHVTPPRSTSTGGVPARRPGKSD